MAVVAITGVGGTGKTSSSKALARLTGWKLVPLNNLAAKLGAYKGYDEKRKSKIVDMKKLAAELKKLEKEHKDIIIEGLFAHEFDSDLIIVLRCRPDILKKRLKKKYSWRTKIVENTEAELIGLITDEAVFRHRSDVFEIDTTKSTPGKTAKKMAEIIRKRPEKYRAGRIDWSSMPQVVRKSIGGK